MKHSDGRLQIGEKANNKTRGAKGSVVFFGAAVFQDTFSKVTDTVQPQ